MPEIKRLLQGKRSELPKKDKLSDFVAEYWHYNNITKMSEDELIRILRFFVQAKTARSHFSSGRAEFLGVAK